MLQPSSPLSHLWLILGRLQFLKDDVLVYWYKIEQAEIQEPPVPIHLLLYLQQA